MGSLEDLSSQGVPPRLGEALQEQWESWRSWRNVRAPYRHHTWHLDDVGDEE